MYMPALDFLGSGHFKFPENDQNISPFSKSSTRFVNLQPISLTAICAVTDFDRDTAASQLKQIFVEFINQSRKR